MNARTVVALLACASPGCALSVEGELPDVEVVQPDVRFPGIPAEAVSGEPTLAIPVAHAHDRLGLPGEGFSEVRVREVALTAKSGVGDLGFIRSLRITVAAAGASPGAPVEIGRYERKVAPGAVGAVIRMKSDPPVDVVDAWRSDAVMLVFEVAGALPEVNWSIDVGVRYKARLRLDE